MKTMLFKNAIFTFLVSSMMLVAFPSCEEKEVIPEPSLEASIAGTWDITSYNLDGDEWMGLIIESSFVTFEEPTHHSGIFLQELTFADGEVTTITGRYILDETNMQLTLYAEGEPIVVDIVITGGNKMHWESLQDGNPLVIEATKRP